MDKLRAIQYFNSAVAAGSLAEAARRLGVSTAAVAQLVASLERTLGTVLLHRTTRGISLTAAGAQYHEVSSQLESALRQIEQRLGPRGAQPRGTLTVGMRTGIGHNCVMPHIGRFLERFPDVELVVKPMETLDEFDRLGVDVAVTSGWPPERDFIVRPLARARNVVCASPSYWARAGMPAQPEDLRDHHCLVFRSSGGALLDRWAFDKQGQRREVNVGGQLFSDGVSWVDSAACHGAGVIRKSDITLAMYFEQGLLVPALTDWEGLDAPEHFAAYRRTHRQSKGVRAFVEFLVEVFDEIRQSVSAPGRGGPARMAKPHWYGRVHGRLSAAGHNGLSSARAHPPDGSCSISVIGSVGDG